MPLLEKKIYTIEAIYALPEGKRAELIDEKEYLINNLKQYGIIRRKNSHCNRCRSWYW